MMAFSGCSEIRLGSATPNDPTPAGSLVTQAELTGLNGRTVSGAAQIYKLDSTGEFIVRLNGLTLTPSVSGLTVVAVAGGTTVLSASLRATRGTMNYSTGDTSAALTWTSVTIHSPTANQDYATATF